MSNINLIQKRILELSGGEFEKLFDAYLYKKYGFNNIQTLGVETGTNKPTKGTPDSYVYYGGDYILITCGTVKENPVNKIKSDVMACLDRSMVRIDRNKIKRIICGHTSTNIPMDRLGLRRIVGYSASKSVTSDAVRAPFLPRLFSVNRMTSTSDFLYI